MDELYFKGVRFISSKRASEITGYTKDYIGQLCRAEKIDSRLVGRNWYVNERSIYTYRTKKIIEEGKKQVQENFIDDQVRYISGAILQESPYYKPDRRSLIPNPVKSFSKNDTVTSQLVRHLSQEQNKEEKHEPASVTNPKLQPSQLPQQPLQSWRDVLDFREIGILLPFSIATLGILIFLLFFAFESVGQYRNNGNEATIITSQVRFSMPYNQ